ncbi:MAG: TfoX/Sxy family protein [Patescibacteria group bacterium]
MKRNSEFHDYVVGDLLSDVAGITSRAMFGGYGIYKDGKIFAIIVEGELYFKGIGGTTQFTYSKKDGKTYKMNYWLVPAEVMENREALADWVQRACAVGF